MTQNSTSTDGNAPLGVLKYTLTVGVICAIAFLAQRAVYGVTLLDFDDIPLANAIAACAGTGCVAGTCGGVFAIAAAAQGQRIFAIGMTGFCIVLPISIAVLALAKPGRVELSDLESAFAVSAMTGALPWMMENYRRRARAIVSDHSELFEPPQKSRDEQSEFDLS